MGAKRTTLSRMMDAVEAIQAAGVAVIGCYILGSDGETPETIDRLRRHLETDPCADVQITLQTPFPGTALRKRLRAQKRLLPGCDWSHHTLFDAILDLASSRWTLWIGVLFVLSAGLAREYDGEDLVHEPWHALRPLAASLASGTALFLVVHLTALLRSNGSLTHRPGFFLAWRRFMGLFWMTAPMAWLYAIPYERMVDPVDAIRLNLWTLALVALWRVVLMVRVINVLYGIRNVFAFFLVMLFADAVVFVVITTVPTPVIDVMGGIRQSERDALLSGVTLMVTLLAVLTAPLWIIGSLVSMAMLRPSWPELPSPPGRSGAVGLFAVAVLLLLAFVPPLIMSQPEQINQREVEKLFERGSVPEALAKMSALEPGDFPPQWNPPPKLGYRETVPSLDAVRDAMIEAWPADWVAELYLDKINRRLKFEIEPFWGDTDWEAIAEMVMENPDYYQMKVDEEIKRAARFLHDHMATLSDAERQALLQIAEHEPIEPENAAVTDP
eukprot:g12205.t1